jgi:hypothetical protein
MTAATLTATTGPTVRIDQPAWYVQLDDESRQLVDEVLATLHQKAPNLTEDEHQRVFWRALEHLGIRRA